MLLVQGSSISILVGRSETRLVLSLTSGLLARLGRNTREFIRCSRMFRIKLEFLSGIDQTLSRGQAHGARHQFSVSLWDSLLGQRDLSFSLCYPAVASVAKHGFARPMEKRLHNQTFGGRQKWCVKKLVSRCQLSFTTGSWEVCSFKLGSGRTRSRNVGDLRLACSLEDFFFFSSKPIDAQYSHYSKDWMIEPTASDLNCFHCTDCQTV